MPKSGDVLAKIPRKLPQKEDPAETTEESDDKVADSVALVKENLLSVSDAAKQAGMSEAAFKKQM